MVTTIASKPNHYERLGLSPDAGDAEIARAFATAMSPLMPRSVRDIVEIGVAFETLRDPARRRAYDESIAPLPEPVREPEIEPERGAMFPRDGWPIIASARIRSAGLPPVESLRRPPPDPEPELRIERKAALPEPVAHEGEGHSDWRRPVATLGGLFLGVAAIGAGLGWYASRGMTPAQAEQPVSFPVPRAAEPAAEVPPAIAAQVRPVERPSAPPRKAARKAPAAEPAPAQAQRAEDVPDIPSEQVAALTSSAAEAPASMPLPDSVVARTIGRIGYACGEVASTSAIEGAPGAFKVTCTSGNSYRAAPVRGRYHFKRWRD